MAAVIFTHWHPTHENMTPSTIREVHNIGHCRHKRTKPQTQATHTENFVKFEIGVFEICERTDKQTYHKKIAILLVSKNI